MDRVLAADLAGYKNKKVALMGWVASIRTLGAINFVILRDRSGTAQVKFDEKMPSLLDSVTDESVVRLKGKVVEDERAPGGIEVQAESLELISKASEEPPIILSKKELKANPETILDHRALSLRHQTISPVFKIQQAIAQTFTEFLISEGFTEIHTPKIVKEGAEGGAEVFELGYFGQKAYLSQSPQLYKQMMVGVFERVFEVGYAYRAEQHNTSRHLNEYVSLDLEIGFITDHSDVMKLEQSFLTQLIDDLAANFSKEFDALGVGFPSIPPKIPFLKLAEAQKIIEQKFKQSDVLGKPDLDPEEEKLICEYATKELGSEFIFITHYPSSKRPFYAYDDPDDPGMTRSFDLLFRGVEVTTGGQRIHEYDSYIEKMKKRKMDPSNFEGYLEAFKYGMPPHGGLAIGLERLTMKLLNLNNVREASLFPRDRNRLTP